VFVPNIVVNFRISLCVFQFRAASVLRLFSLQSRAASVLRLQFRAASVLRLRHGAVRHDPAES
jgi:hypothetical protein